MQTPRYLRGLSLGFILLLVPPSGTQAQEPTRPNPLQTRWGQMLPGGLQPGPDWTIGLAPGNANTPPSPSIREGKTTPANVNSARQHTEPAGNAKTESTPVHPLNTGFFQGVIPTALPTDFLGTADRYPIAAAFQGMSRERVQNSNATLAYNRVDANALVPVYWNRKDQGIFFQLNARALAFDSDARLSRGLPFPEELFDIRPGFLGRVVLDNGWIFGGNFSIASPSDRPFERKRDILPFAVGYWNIPRDNGDAYVLSLVYTPGSNIGYPIPGFSYQWNPTADFSMSVGVPLELRWRIYEDWFVEAGYIPVRLARAQLTWKPRADWQVFWGFEWINDGYKWSRRIEDGDFFYHLEKRLEWGTRWSCGRVTIDALLGYSFDRLFFTGQDYQDRFRDFVQVEPGLFGLLRIGLRF